MKDLRQNMIQKIHNESSKIGKILLFYHNIDLDMLIESPPSPELSTNEINQKKQEAKNFVYPIG